MAAMDYNLFLSDEAKKTEPMPIRNMFEVILKGPKDLVTLASGSPSPTTFPLQSISLKFQDGAVENIDWTDMQRALQYGATAGSVTYRKLLRDLVFTIHSPPCFNKSPAEGGTVVMPTAGATDGNHQMINLLLNPGDNVIVEKFTYPALICIFQTIGANPLKVDVDANGIIPDSLRDIMSRWDRDSPPGTAGKPRVLYTIPTGQNPTGCSLTLERKHEIYKIAQEYNLLIVEDDAYYMLNYNERIPSFLALDTDGRVVRLDTFSKSIAPGLRAGFISGPASILAKVEARLGVTSHGTCPFSQEIITALFRRWGIDGYLARAKQNSEYYLKQRDLLVKYIDKWMNGLVEYSMPTSGMFLWVKVTGCDDTQDLLYNKAVIEGVLAVPGSCFTPGVAGKCSYIRLSYSQISEEDMDTGMKRLGEVIRKHVVRS